MKKVFAVALGLLAMGLFSVGLADSGSKHVHATKSASHSKMQMTKLTGEVVDLACYMGEGKMGMSHRQCAIKCAKLGIPFAIKDEKGNLTLVLFGNKKAKPMYDEIGNQGGKKVTVEGMLLTKGGMRAILVGPAEM